MQYLFLDTNIYLNCALIREPGHDSDLLGKLRELLQQHQTVLLLPEVVELEFGRVQQELLEQLRETIAKAEKQVESLEVPAYVKGELQPIARAMNDIVTRREKSRAGVQDLLGAMTSSPVVERLSLTPELMVAGYKRALLGKPPFKMKISPSLLDADCMIFETLANFLKNHAGQKLLFCSANRKDFASFDKESNHHIMLPELVEELAVEVRYYASLPELIEVVLSTQVEASELARYKEAEELVSAQPAPAPFGSVQVMEDANRIVGIRGTDAWERWRVAADVPSGTFQKWMQDLRATPQSGEPNTSTEAS